MGWFSRAAAAPPQMTINSPDAEVPLIPPIIFFSLLLACATLAKTLPPPYGRYRFLPDWLAPLRVRTTLFALVLSLGVYVFAAAANDLHAADSGVSFTPVGGIATGGMYAHSRNPLYVLFAFVILPSLAMAFDCAWPLFAAAPMFLYLSNVVIPAEEAFLERHYGAAYTAYAASTPRWLLVTD